MSTAAALWTSPPWQPAVEAALRPCGLEITETSDALELLGYPRLSTSTPQQRVEAPSRIATLEGLRALATVRSARSWLLKQLEGLPPAHLVACRRQLGFVTRRRAVKPIEDLRLGELSQLVGLATEPAPRAYGCTFHPIEAELFGEERAA